MHHTLWKTDNPAGKTCPSSMPFSIRFPSSYHDGERSRRLPPSYEVTYHGIPAIVAKCSYSLSLMVTRIRHKRVSFWTSCKTYVIIDSYHNATRCNIPHLLYRRTIGLNHRPRSRPHRPVLPINSLFSTIKRLPEEWRQIVTEMGTRPGSTISPITCHVSLRPVVM